MKTKCNLLCIFVLHILNIHSDFFFIFFFCTDGTEGLIFPKAISVQTVMLIFTRILQRKTCTADKIFCDV